MSFLKGNKALMYLWRYTIRSNALYMMMLTTGYLKVVDIDWNPAGGELARCMLLIPNREIQTIYRE